MVLQIDLKRHLRMGRAITSFAVTQPPADSDMAQEAFENPYVFDFLNLTERSRERELETSPIRLTSRPPG